LLGAADKKNYNNKQARYFDIRTKATKKMQQLHEKWITYEQCKKMPITDEHYISASIITHLSANRQQMKTTADRSAIFYAQIGATSPLPKQVTLHVPRAVFVTRYKGAWG